MTIDQLTELFAWMTMINIGIMLLSAVLISTLKGFITKTHGKMFKVGDETLHAILYSYLGLYKIAIIMFNLVPYLALQLIK